ncbi:MAG: SRPBCC domain-containing protein [Isosphaeraceae bacterium]
MPDSSQSQPPGRAVFQVFIQGPIDAVWREITKADSVQKAMFDMRLHTPGLKPGAPFQMRSKDGKVVGIVGEVLEIDPPHRYVTTFKFTRFDDPPCKIIYELREVVGGTEFTMTLDGLPPGTATSKQMVQGGPLITKNLKALVETGRLPLGTKVLYALFTILGPLAPKKTHAENWPMAGA